MAVGAGWQAVVAYVNVGCYYLFGIPLGLLLGFALHWGVLVSPFSLSKHYSMNSSPSTCFIIIIEWICMLLNNYGIQTPESNHTELLNATRLVDSLNNFF